MQLLVATHNPGKMQEFRHLLADLPVEIRFPADFNLRLAIPEDGDTYLQNASQKALAYANMTKRITLADDSGLEVDALGGAPGLYSARYVPGEDMDRVTALLTTLRDVPVAERTARFRCVIVIATPQGEVYSAEGVCEGQITQSAAGQGGFGYDPIFYLPDLGCTMAQIPEQQKNQISHRARAVQAALPILRQILDEDKNN